MAEHQTHRNDPFASLKSWVGIIVLLIGFAVQWGVFTQQIVQLRTEQLAVEQRLVKVNEEQNRHFEALDAQMASKVSLLEQAMVEIKVQLASMQKDILYIRQSVDLHMEESKR